MNRKLLCRLLRVTALLLCGLLTGGFCLSCQSGGTEDPTVGTPTGADPVTEAPTDPAESAVPTDPEAPSDTEPATEAETQPDALSAADAAAALRSTHFTQTFGAVDPCGLSDPSAVGIDEAAFNTVLYPAPDDSTCRVLVNAADYGIKPENEDNSKAFSKMLTDLSDAVGRVKIVFPVGVYRFSQTIKLAGVSRLTICSDTPGTPFTILMTEWTPGIRVSDSSDVRFVDFAFTYETPSAIAGTIVSATNQSVVIRVDDRFDLSDPHYRGGTVNYGSYMEMALDGETGKYYPDLGANLLYNSTGDGARSIGGGSYNAETHELTLEFPGKIKKPAEGTVVNVAYTMYDNCGFSGENCKDIYLESVHMYHTTGMAIAMTGCENVYLNRVFLSPAEDSGMLMTATADGFHCINCTGDISVTSCIFEMSHDDCMNVNGRYLTVVSNQGDTVNVESMTVTVNKGDELDLYSKDDLHFIGTVTVKSIKGNALTCDGVTADMKNCFACNITTSPRLTIRNCFFGNKRNRGMLIQVRNVIIENCVFRNIAHGPIQIFTVPSSFGEGICPKDVVVRNNKFIGNNAADVDLFSWAANGAKAPGVICNVDIVNNYFNRSGYYPVQIGTAGNVNVKNNLFDNVCVNPNSMNPKCVVYVNCSRDVTVSDNAVLSLPKRFSFDSEREVQRDKKCENVVFENNTVIE